MIREFLVYFVLGALLAWPAWKLTRMLLHRSGLHKPASRCFEAYVPAKTLNLANHSGPDRV